MSAAAWNRAGAIPAEILLAGTARDTEQTKGRKAVGHLRSTGWDAKSYVAVNRVYPTRKGEKCPPGDLEIDRAATVTEDPEGRAAGCLVLGFRGSDCRPWSQEWGYHPCGPRRQGCHRSGRKKERERESIILKP